MVRLYVKSSVEKCTLNQERDKLQRGGPQTDGNTTRARLLFAEEQSVLYNA